MPCQELAKFAFIGLQLFFLRILELAFSDLDRNQFLSCIYYGSMGLQTAGKQQQISHAENSVDFEHLRKSRDFIGFQILQFFLSPVHRIIPILQYCTAGINNKTAFAGGHQFLYFPSVELQYRCVPPEYRTIQKYH